MADIRFLEPKKSNSVQFNVSPVYNLFSTLSCLSQDLDGLTGWIPEAKKRMPQNLLDANDAYNNIAMLFIRESHQSFPEYLEFIENIEPMEIAKAEADHLKEKAQKHLGISNPPELKDFIADKASYSELIEKLNLKFYKDADCCYIDENYEKFSNPEAYKDKMLQYLRTIWNDYLSEEWESVHNEIENSVDAFNSLDLKNKNTEQIILQIIERDELPETLPELLSKNKTIQFIPSAHIGPYLLVISVTDDCIKIVTRARIPEGAQIRDLAMERSELLMQLTGISDDTRLQILHLAAIEDSITTQFVMEKLQLSQSSASRHLNQLTSIGYLSAKPQERIKHYKLNHSKIENTFTLLKDFLKK